MWRDLRTTLPEYMIPAGIVFLPALPLTPNGKIDRAVLPDPNDLSQMRAGWRIPPQTLLHSTLATIWEDLLGVRDVGIRDSFFDIGGHSLLSMRVVAEIDRVIGAKLNPRVMFLESLKQIAAQCDRQLGVLIA